MSLSHSHRRSQRLALLRATFAAAAAFVLAAGLAFGTQAALAQEGDEPSQFGKFQRLDLNLGASGIGLNRFRPGLLRASRPVKVIVRVSGESVGDRIAEARRQGRDLGQAERAAIRAEVRGRQQPVEQRVRELGGEVLADYQDAYNGIAVRIAGNQLPVLLGSPGVIAVHASRVIEPNNVAGVQYIEAHHAWQDLGLTGRGIKIGIIDSGVDYTHANFGGPGTEEAFERADANDTTLADGGFPTEKVVGGYDFVGDDYDAGATDEEIATDPNIIVPRPDPDPLDCDGHGSHVAGSAAGFGVLNGETYEGPYNASTFASFPTGFPQPRNTIGPGVAPEALIYAYRVFGCAGSTSEEVLVDALDRALEDGVDVVNMSLGSVLGRVDEPSSVSSNTLAEAGVVIVASAGNNGSSAYITGAPAVANRAISVAALDASTATFPGARIALPSGPIDAINANAAPLPSTPLQIKVLRNADGTVSLGCNPAEYVDVAGKLVVTLRGTCARVARAIYGQKAGAAAVAMINTAAVFPPFEGEITENPDTGEEFTVTIPFLGIRGVLGPSPFDDPDRLVAADGATVTLTPAEVTNPGFRNLATFTSGGPRNVDSAQKPDVTAPGVSVFSTDVGTGNLAAAFSGTSMAAPMTAGVAALLTQAHPTWSTERIKAAIMNTADAGSAKIVGWDPRRAGAGVVNARRAVDTAGLALAGQGQSTLSYGYEPLAGAYSESLPFRLENTGSSPITYNLSSVFVGNNRGATMTFDRSSVTVAAGGSETVNVTLALSAAAVAALPNAVASNFGALAHQVRGAVVATPTTSGARVYTLRVPFMLVPRGLSNVTTGVRARWEGRGNDLTSSITVTNTGIHAGDADVYAWGINDANDVPHPEDSMDVRAAGVQMLPGGALGGAETDRTLVFAVNMYGRWSNPSVSEVDVAIDLESDGRPEYFVVGVDIGAVTAGAFDGRFASLIFSADGRLINAWVATAPMNGSTMLLPTLASDVGIDLSRGSTKVRYTVAAFSIVPSDIVDVTETGEFRLDKPPVSTGQYATLAPGQSATLPLQVDRGQAAGTKVYGWMIVSMDDPNGPPQAELVPLDLR